MVIGGDSCYKGCEYEYRHHVLDGHFFTYVFVVKFVVCDFIDKINEKKSGVGPFLKNTFWRNFDSRQAAAFHL